MKINFLQIKFSVNTKKLILTNLVVLILGVILIFTLLGYFGLGRGDIGVFVINFSEEPTILSGTSTAALNPFEIYSFEVTLSAPSQLGYEGGTLELVPMRTPVVYGLVVGSAPVSQICLAKTSLTYDLKSIGTQFEIAAATPGSAHSYRFNLPLEQLWWPGKPIEGTLNNSRNDYIYIFPIDCDRSTAEELAQQAKFWLQYDIQPVKNYYDQKLLEVETDSSYRDPGPQ